MIAGDGLTGCELERLDVAEHAPPDFALVAYHEKDSYGVYDLLKLHLRSRAGLMSREGDEPSRARLRLVRQPAFVM